MKDRGHKHHLLFHLSSSLFLALFVIFALPISSLADVMVIKIAGIVNPVMSEFITKSIDNAVNEGDELLVIELDTPGGLDTSMRSIVQKIMGSSIPVAVYVSPTGARAASAGVFITVSAHIAAMAPGTNIGAAHPVGVGGKMDKTMAEKAVNDAAAYIKSLAEKRGRNTKWAEEAVRKSVSITHEKALELNVIDIVAEDINDLLTQINGMVVETTKGKITLNTKDVNIKHREMGLRHKILNLISDPNVAYLLMLLGFYGIFFELTNPGAIFPGVFGTIALILALYSFQTLPVNYAGLMLIVFGIILFVLEVKVTSFGLLTIGGIISMIIGSLMLFESPLPFFKVSLKVILPAVILTAAFFIIIVTLALKAYRRKPATGREGLIGLEGEAQSDIDKEGTVFVHGEIWRAWSDEPIKKGQKVIIESVDKLKLKVKPK
jgi:membrane-bound serine protease (ClpP class)